MRAKIQTSLEIFFALAAFFAFVPVSFAAVEISEIAWMGTVPKEGESAQAAANNEWIELFNSGVSQISLEGWRLVAEDGMPDVALSGVVPAGGYFLLERGSDDIVPNIAADLVYPFKNNALSNPGERLFLKNASGEVLDEVNALGGWPAGDNTTKDTMQKISGSWQTFPPTPKAPPPTTGGASPQTSESSSGSASSGSAASSQGSQNQTSVEVEEESKIKAQISGSRSGVAGAEISFEGKALGFSGTEIQAQRYLWSFGDGGFGEGRRIFHAFLYPGKYHISFSAKVAEDVASDYQEIEIIENKFSIVEVKGGKDSWIKLSNSSSLKLDISGWRLRANAQGFVFPAGTYILANTTLVIPEKVSGLSLGSRGKVELLYPNNAVASSFEFQETSGPPETPPTLVPEPKPSVKTLPSAPGRIEEKDIEDKSLPGEIPTPSEFQSSENAKQEALVSKPFFSKSFYTWGLAALGVAALAGLGFIASRRL